MGLLKKIYIAWGGVFWGIIFLFSSLYAYFSDIEFFGDMLKIAFFIYSYPLLPYISYLTLQETIKSKNIFLYFSLFFFISGGFFNYVITLGIYTFKSRTFGRIWTTFYYKGFNFRAVYLSTSYSDRTFFKFDRKYE